MEKLGGKEVNSVLGYIGGEGGYLGNFTYASHAQFYPMYCGVDIDPNEYEGTTRQRFIKILSEAEPFIQSKILQGVIDKCTLEYFEDRFNEGFLTQYEFEQKKRIHYNILTWISGLKGQGLLEAKDLVYNYNFVQETLDQCQTLISQHNCRSAVDRAHTALHGYLKETCKNAGLILKENNPRIQDYWSKLKQEHPSILVDYSQSHLPINQIINAIGKLLENLNDIRNNKSYTHPNEEIIGEEEAKLVINLFRSILNYIDSKI
ncbi:abortive infection family protein [Paenibacillus cucumis (ex Kampfer et al. 2016)]|uniref:Abortive infection family protein n=1 Tax=Paenibacillus cucumis (ex Kampfer et al. 2016) TaxID=1776858 RepID=A0ABS7KE94_9BACL|nr:abortive infection family protein [Paenibacillus cucumis (ex Kampfer et al. 2016)]MBY0202444.1 abortive infection family protein [Paenibacillus cucumis (ex Kampfer et al. 2016)]